MSCHNSDDDDFDTNVFMLCGNDDDVIMDEDDIMMDPYSTGPSSPSTMTSEDEVKWRIEYEVQSRNIVPIIPSSIMALILILYPHYHSPHWLDSG